MYCNIMLTRDDLSAIKKVVKEEVRDVEERQAVKDNGLEERLGGKIKDSEGVLREEMKSMEARLEKKISKVQETIDIVQNVVVKHYGELEQRVTNIEEELRNPRN